MKRMLALVAALCCLALPLGATAKSHVIGGPMSGAMPACKSGDPVVWVNSRTNVFHLPGDSYYGKTKAGKYACKSDAVAMGARMSGSKLHKGATAGATAEDAADATPSAMPMKMKHHRKRSAMPEASPTP